jgi:tRNA nucleotidyltransferase/poly(A) polymerase
LPDPGPDPRFRALLESPLARALAGAGGGAPVWLVGGAVRDVLLGREVADLDAVVEGDGEAVAAALARGLGARLVRLGGDRFGALRVVARDGEVDLWPLAGATIESDLARRDFTVNAIAIDAVTGSVLDPFGGLDDLSARRLRATRATVFEEDALRVVRLARFAATLPGFSAEPGTVARSRAAAPGLAAIPGERIRAELERLWSDAAFETAQRALEQSGAWPELWRSAPRADPAESSAIPAAARLDRACSRSGGLSARARIAGGHVLAARGAAGAAAPEAIARLAERRALPVAEAREIRRLLDLVAEAPPRDDGDVAWLLHRSAGFHALVPALAEALADEAARGSWRTVQASARRLLSERGETILEPRPLLDGVEIGSRLGIGPGAEVGAAVRRLREAQVRGEVRTREEAEALLAGRELRSDRPRGPSGAD